MAPSLLTASPASSQRIDLVWADNSVDEEGFVIERREDGDAWTPIVLLPANQTSFADAGLVAAKSYQYRVGAFNGALLSDYSNTATATTHSLPAAPTDLIAAGVSSQRIHLSWTDQSSDEDGFQIERSLTGTDWSLLATVGAGQTGYADTGLGPMSSYSYRVRAYRGEEVSAYAGPAPATTLPLPAVPANLTATLTTSDRIDLAWTDNSADEHGFVVERSRDDGAWSEIAALEADTAAYADTDLVPGAKYSYRVYTRRGEDRSDWSNTATATTPAPIASPTDLTATAVSAWQIDLTWKDPADNETGFRIERSTDGTTFEEIVTVGANVTSFTVAILVPETKYYFRVRAANTTGASAYSNTASATTPPEPSYRYRPPGLRSPR
jgi:titin